MKKTFKIVMLPAKKADVNSLWLLNNGKISLDNHLLDDETFVPHHLYILSDEEIKEGDWCFYRNHLDGGNIICQAYKHSDDKRMLFDDGTHNKNIGEGITPLSGECKKIVATTDKSLGEPRPHSKALAYIPESFTQAYIKAYNEGKPITEVDLDMEVANCANIDVYNQCDGHKHTFKIKTRPDNTVIVHQSKMYTKNEVIELLQLMHNHYTHSFSDAKWVNEWIQDNL